MQGQMSPTRLSFPTRTILFSFWMLAAMEAAGVVAETVSHSVPTRRESRMGKRHESGHNA